MNKRGRIPVNQRSLIFAVGLGFLSFLIFKTMEAAVIGAIIGFILSLVWR